MSSNIIVTVSQSMAESVRRSRKSCDSSKPGWYRGTVMPTSAGSRGQSGSAAVAETVSSVGKHFSPLDRAKEAGHSETIYDSCQLRGNSQTSPHTATGLITYRRAELEVINAMEGIGKWE